MGTFSVAPKYLDRIPVFGYSPSKEQVAAEVGYGGVKVLEQNEALDNGHYFDALVYGAVSLEGLDGGEKRTVDIPNAIISVTQTKNIVKTDLITRQSSGAQQVKGTVKEYISMGDDQITISGVIVSKKGVLDRPLDDIYRMELLWRTAAELTVTNEYLGRLYINQLVIESIEWMPHRYVNTQPFRMTCLGDDRNLYAILNASN